MPRFQSFTGIRYSTRVDLSVATAPPYEDISSEQRAYLASRHSANAVRVELPEADYRTGLDKYENAAHLLTLWEADGLLVPDPEPALYAYRMTTPGGQVTNGVIGSLGIEDASAADILPHEQTLSKAKSDRLELLRATRMNLSPIWGLSLTNGLTALFISDDKPDASATDGDGVLHELWVISDRSVIEAVDAAVSSSPVVVADGHHRYETARAYRHEQLDSLEGTPDEGADGVMALIVELSEDQLHVGPIHRGLSGLPDGLDLVDAFSSWFDVTRAGDFTERTTSALGETEALALIMPSGSWLLSPKDGTPEAAGAPIDSSMVALVIAELPDHELEFFNHWEDGMAAIASERVQAVVLLRPVLVEQIAEWAHARRRMPPKSTYFHPKPRTGMVFRSLDAG